MLFFFLACIYYCRGPLFIFFTVQKNRVATQPGKPGKVKEFDIWPKYQKIVRKFQHFIQNSGKIWEFENFNAGSNFHANFKTKLLNIQSYIGTLNRLFLIVFITKSQILVNITCSWNILVLSSNAILIVSPACWKSLRC